MRTTFLTSVFAAIALGSFTGCANQQNMMAETAMRGGNVRYDAETGAMYRLYEYFPTQQVYRSVYRYTYFWKDQGGAWRMGPTLPGEIQLGSHYELIELPSGRPFDFHEQVVSEFPTNEMLTEQLARMESEAILETFANVPTDLSREALSMIGGRLRARG